MMASAVEGLADGVDVVAVDALGEPAESLELLIHRLRGQHAARRTVRLLIVEIDNGDEVVEPVMTSRHGRLPGRALAQLAVRQEIVDEAPGPLPLQAERHADGDAEPVTQ
jgi:hypothetical protein